MKKKKGLYAVLVVLVFLALSGKTMYDRVSSPAETFREGSGEPRQELTLYARSAVLMDADTGRILYDKDGETPMPMASTTKIMTLITALELAQDGEIAEASAYAAGQPKVRLGMQAGEQFYLSDLYYSLMLESHNDTAVCIAETIGRRLLKEGERGQVSDEQESNAPKTGNQAHSIDSKTAVHAFVSKMNEKAATLGLSHTYFVTPNGLDGEEELADGTKRGPQHHCGGAGGDPAVLHHRISQTGGISCHYPDCLLYVFGCGGKTKLFLYEPQSVSAHDGRRPHRENGIYSKGGLLLCGSAAAGEADIHRGASGLRLA